MPETPSSYQPLPPSESSHLSSIEQMSRLKISRRQVLTLLGLGGAGLATGSLLRVAANENGSWKSAAYGISDLMSRAQKHQKGFEFGSYLEEQGDVWSIANSLRETIQHEDKVGVFANLEWADQEKYPGRMEKLLELIHDIPPRGATSLLSIHIGERPNNLHPLHPTNRAWLFHLVDKFFEIMDREYPFPLEIRLLYEMNLPDAFEYGLNKGLGDRAQERGFKELAIYFADRRDQSPYERRLAFCPSAWHDFDNYYVQPRNRRAVFDTAGLDGYDIFPGSLLGILGSDIPLTTRVQLLGYYLILGQRSPEQVFERAMGSLNVLTEESIPRYIYEMGTKTGDAEWLDHAVWLAAAMGFDGAVPFTINKEYQVRQQHKAYESDWGNHALAAAPLWAATLPALNARVQIP